MQPTVEERVCPVCEKATAHQLQNGFMGCVPCRVRREISQQQAQAQPQPAPPAQPPPAYYQPPPMYYPPPQYQRPQRVFVAYEWTGFRIVAAVAIVMIVFWIVYAIATADPNTP